MSNQELMVKKFEDVEVFFMEDGYINATQVAKEFSKRSADWLRTDETQDYIKALTRMCVIEQNQLVIVRKGSPDNGGGTWLHPKLGVVFARWLSVDFAIWCDEQIENILHNYRVSGIHPQFSTVLHPILHFPVVGRQEDLLMKRTRNTYTSVLNELGFRTAIYKQTLTNNVSRILIGMPVRPFRRLHGIPAGSRRRTRLFYDSNLRRAMNEVEEVSCIQLLEDRPSSFEEIEQVVYQVARTILQYSTMRRVNLLEHIPESDLDELANG